MKRLICAFALLSLATTPVLAKDTYPPVQILLSASETTIGQPITYPTGTAKITSAIVTMQPGKKTGPHLHNVPLYGYMLAGELTVDYGPAGTKTYRSGDSLLEAIGTIHEGTNTGTDVARILVVFMGADGVANTVVEE